MRALRKRYGRAKAPKLTWEKAGTEQRHPLYVAVGVDSIDGTPANYHVHFQHGVWAAGGDNVRRAGGVMGHTATEAKKKVEQIDEAARKAFAGGYSLTPDLVTR